MCIWYAVILQCARKPLLGPPGDTKSTDVQNPYLKGYSICTCPVLYFKASIDYLIQCKHHVNDHYTVFLRNKRNIYVFI